MTTQCPYCGDQAPSEVPGVTESSATALLDHVMRRCPALSCDCVERWRQENGSGMPPVHFVECAVRRAAFTVLEDASKSKLLDGYKPFEGRGSGVPYVPGRATWPASPGVGAQLESQLAVETERASLELMARQVAECFSDDEPLVLRAAGMVAADRIVALKKAIVALDEARKKKDVVGS